MLILLYNVHSEKPYCSSFYQIYSEPLLNQEGTTEEEKPLIPSAEEKEKEGGGGAQVEEEEGKAT